jgi:hypothetical protein
VALVDPFSASEYEGRGVVAVPFEPRIDVRMMIVTSAHRRLSALGQEFVAAFRAHATAKVRPPHRRPRSGRLVMPYDQRSRTHRPFEGRSSKVSRPSK